MLLESGTEWARSLFYCICSGGLGNGWRTVKPNQSAFMSKVWPHWELGEAPEQSAVFTLH